MNKFPECTLPESIYCRDSTWQRTPHPTESPPGPGTVTITLRKASAGEATMTLHIFTFERGIVA